MCLQEDFRDRCVRFTKPELRPYQVVAHLHSGTRTIEIQKWDKQKSRYIRYAQVLDWYNSIAVVVVVLVELNTQYFSSCTLHNQGKRKGEVKPQISTSRRFDKRTWKGSRKDADGETSSLVANAYQVISELLDSVGGNTRLDVFGVVGDEESLLGLDDDKTFLALVALSIY
jgi:hypothetical protein